MPEVQSMTDIDCEIAGIPIEAWSSDTDALMMPSELEAVTSVTGADGSKAFYRTGEYGGEVVIKLLSNSPSINKLWRQIQRQENGQQVNWDGHVVNRRTGERVEFRDGVATKWPLGFTAGAGEIAAQNYTFEYETISRTPGRSRSRN